MLGYPRHNFRWVCISCKYTAKVFHQPLFQFFNIILNCREWDNSRFDRDWFCVCLTSSNVQRCVPITRLAPRKIWFFLFFCDGNTLLSDIPATKKVSSICLFPLTSNDSQQLPITKISPPATCFNFFFGGFNIEGLIPKQCKYFSPITVTSAPVSAMDGNVCGLGAKYFPIVTSILGNVSLWLVQALRIDEINTALNPLGGIFLSLLPLVRHTFEKCPLFSTFQAGFSKGGTLLVGVGNHNSGMVW